MKAGMSYWLALPLAAFATTGITAVAFSPILRTRGLFFAIMTLCFSAIVAEVAGTWESMLGGHTGIPDIPKPVGLGPIDFTTRLHYYYLGLVIVTFSVILVKRITKSQFGITLRLIRDNEVLARHIGINPFKYKLIAVCISSFMAAFVGGFYAPYSKYIHPGISSMWDSLFVQIYGITGGLGHPVAGAIVGTVVLKSIPEIMRVASNLEPMVFGFILILVVLYLPEGLVDLPVKIKKRLGMKRDSIKAPHRPNSA
jgi:branched-chain amino acid transport system permease protein